MRLISNPCAEWKDVRGDPPRGAQESRILSSLLEWYNVRHSDLNELHNATATDALYATGYNQHDERLGRAA